MGTTNATLVLPIHNGAATLMSVFGSLERQNDKGIIKRLILIDDGSDDGSDSIIEEYRKRSSYEIRIISHERSRGLAASYNEGIREAETECVILMQQDIWLISPDSTKEITSPLSEDETIVATYPVVLTPYEDWKAYGFWQKCLSCRNVGKEKGSLMGKFDCYRTDTLINGLGLFDEITFRTAGEDGDMRNRIAGKGLPTSGVETRVVHLHGNDPNFSLGSLVKKEAQMGEARGAILRRYGFANALANPKESIYYFRELLLAGLLVPIIRVISFVLILLYAFLYTRLVYKHEKDNPRVFMLPLVNLTLLFVNFIFSLKGYIYGKQKI